MVLLDAAVFGIPVISTEVKGVPELNSDENDDLLTAPENVAQLNEAIEQFITDRPLATLLFNNLQEKLAPARSAAATYKRHEEIFLGQPPASI